MNTGSREKAIIFVLPSVVDTGHRLADWTARIEELVQFTAFDRKNNLVASGDTAEH